MVLFEVAPIRLFQEADSDVVYILCSDGTLHAARFIQPSESEVDDAVQLIQNHIAGSLKSKLGAPMSTEN